MNTPVTNIEKSLAEYADEYCDWNNTQGLINTAYRYADVSEPTHLHCVAYSLAKKLEQHGIAQESQEAVYYQYMRLDDKWSDPVELAVYENISKCTTEHRALQWRKLYTDPPSTQQLIGEIRNSDWSIQQITQVLNKWEGAK